MVILNNQRSSEVVGFLVELKIVKLILQLNLGRGDIAIGVETCEFLIYFYGKSLSIHLAYRFIFYTSSKLLRISLAKVESLKLFFIFDPFMRMFIINSRNIRKSFGFWFALRKIESEITWRFLIISLIQRFLSLLVVGRSFRGFFIYFNDFKLFKNHPIYTQNNLFRIKSFLKFQSDILEFDADSFFLELLEFRLKDSFSLNRYHYYFPNEIL